MNIQKYSVVIESEFDIHTVKRFYYKENAEFFLKQFRTQNPDLANNTKILNTQEYNV